MKKIVSKAVLFPVVLFTLSMTSCIKEDVLSSTDSYIKIQQDDLQDWDFGIASEKNNVVLVKENDDDGFSYVLFLLHQTEDTISLKYQNDTLTDFYYNSYHFMVSRMDSLLLFTTIDGNMAVSYTVPYYEQIAKCNSKGTASTLIESAVKNINRIFDAESGIDMLRDIENGDRESLIHDMGEFLAEQGFGALPYGSFGVLSYELYKHYLDRLHNKAIQFHIGDASCMIQSVRQNESDNTIEVIVSIENGEDIPIEYTWKNYWGQQVSSPNYIYYGVLCRAGNNYPTLQKYDYYQKELLEPHASLTHTFSFPLLAAEKLLFRSFLGFNYDYHNTALQDGYRKSSLAKYGNVIEFHPEFEITTISNPLEGGTITGGGRYDFNAQVTLTATANNGYEFTHWDDGSESSTRTITVEGDATYTAFFTQPMYTINTIANPSSGGSVTGGGSYTEGTIITLTATANNGYEFTHWDNGSTDHTRTIIVHDNETYTAYFSQSFMNLAGQWTFNQTASLTNPLIVNLVFDGLSGNSAHYHANNLPEGYTLQLYVQSDRTVSIVLRDPIQGDVFYSWTQWATFEGVFNETFSSVSGSSYLHEETSYVAPTGWQVNDSWSFHR